MTEPKNNTQQFFRKMVSHQPFKPHGVRDSVYVEAMIEKSISSPLNREPSPEDPLIFEKTRNVRRVNADGTVESTMQLISRVGISPLQILMWDIPRIEAFVAEQERQAREQ